MIKLWHWLLNLRTGGLMIGMVLLLLALLTVRYPWEMYILTPISALWTVLMFRDGGRVR